MSEDETPRQSVNPNLLRGRSKDYHPPNLLSEDNPLAELSRQKARINENARGSQPSLVIEELFAEAAKFAVGRLKKMNRVKGEIARSDIEVVRETRQLADRAFEIISARGQVAAADALLATVDTRLEAVASVLERCARAFEPPAAS